MYNRTTDTTGRNDCGNFGGTARLLATREFFNLFDREKFAEGKFKPAQAALLD